MDSLKKTAEAPTLHPALRARVVRPAKSERWLAGVEGVEERVPQVGEEMYEDPDDSSDFLPSSPGPLLGPADRPQSLESLYAKVNKTYTKRSSVSSPRASEASSGAESLASDLTSEVASEAPVTLRQASPAPQGRSASPADSSCIIYEELPAAVSAPQTVTVQINRPPAAGDGEGGSPARGGSPLPTSTPSSPPSSPLIPKRTTSIFQRFQAALSRGDTFKSYISEFPPDQEAMLSPREEERAEVRELPPRPSTTPLRTRSVFYNSVLSDRSTPSLPSLSHSYETLNGSDTAEQIYRTPHRPAPAPPGEI